MIIYFSLIFFIDVLSYILKNKKNGEKYFSICAFILLTIISGLRNYSVGVDTGTYISFFSKVKDISIYNLFNLRYEYGFSIFCKIIALISTNYHFFLLVTSGFINFCVLRYIYINSKNVSFSVILYILCNFFFSYMNILRQALAISIILLGYEYLKKDKFLVFSLFVIFAAQFHVSALLCFIFIFLKKCKYNKKFVIVFFIASIITFCYGKDIFYIICEISPRLNAYLYSEYAKANYFGALFECMVLVVQFLIGFLIILSNKKQVLNTKSNNLNTIVGIISVACLLSVLAMKATIFSRFVHYFSVFSIIWIPNCIYLLRNYKIRYFAKMITIFLFFCYFIIISIYRPEWYGVIPYVFYN